MGIGGAREKAGFGVKGGMRAVCHLGKGVVLSGISVDRADIIGLLRGRIAAGQGKKGYNQQ